MGSRDRKAGERLLVIHHTAFRWVVSLLGWMGVSKGQVYPWALMLRRASWGRLDCCKSHFPTKINRIFLLLCPCLA